MATTTRIRFTHGPLGIIAADHLYRFVAETVSEGDEGNLLSEAEAATAVGTPDGWRVVQIEDGPGWFRGGEWGDGEIVARYVPVHPSMIERVN